MIFPQIKYGDVWLNNSSQEIEDWMSLNIPLDQILLESPLRSFVQLSRQANRAMPEPKIGSVYWPTGATRFAVGYFLCHVSKVRSIFPGTFRPLPKTLLIGQTTSDSDFRVELKKMYALPPISLAVWGGMFDLYLLVLVDERYYWRWVSWFPQCNSYMGFPKGVMNWSDWKGACSSLAGGVTIDTPTSIEPEHKFTNIASMTSHRGRNGVDGIPSMPEIFEAGAITLGRKIVSNYITSKYELQTNDEYEELLADNLERFGTSHRRAGFDTFEAGGDTLTAEGAEGGPAAFALTRQGIMPQSVEVLFPAIHKDTGLPFENVPDGFYRKAIPLSTAGVYSDEQGVSFTHTIRDSYPAVIQADSDGIVVKNQTDLDALALLIATSFYQQFSQNLDIVYNGPCKLKPCGTYDTIEWHLSHKDCYTRVRSAPWNSDYHVTHHGAQTNAMYTGIQGPMHQFLIATLVEPLVSGQKALADIRLPGEIDTPTHRFYVEDEFNKVTETLPVGMKIGVMEDRHFGQRIDNDNDPDPIRFTTPRYVVIVARCT